MCLHILCSSTDDASGDFSLLGNCAQQSLCLFSPDSRCGQLALSAVQARDGLVSGPDSMRAACPHGFQVPRWGLQAVRAACPHSIRISRWACKERRQLARAILNPKIGLASGVGSLPARLLSFKIVRRVGCLNPSRYTSLGPLQRTANACQFFYSAGVVTSCDIH